MPRIQTFYHDGTHERRSRSTAPNVNNGSVVYDRARQEVIDVVSDKPRGTGIEAPFVLTVGCSSCVEVELRGDTGLGAGTGGRSWE